MAVKNFKYSAIHLKRPITNANMAYPSAHLCFQKLNMPLKKIKWISKNAPVLSLRLAALVLQTGVPIKNPAEAGLYKK